MKPYLYRKERVLTLIALLFLLVISLYRYSDAVFSSDYALANSGDGIASIAAMYSIPEQILDLDSSYLYSDQLKMNHNGGYFANPGPVSQFWKLTVSVFGALFEPDMAYDLIGMLVGFLAACTGYYLFRCLGLSIVYSLALAVTISSFDVVVVRANSHLLGLGSIFIPILVVCFTIRLGNDLKFRSLMLLGLIHVINFNANEYYGYFGVWYSMSYLFVAMLINYKLLIEKGIKNLSKSIFTSLMICTVLMLLLYPNVISKPIISILTSIIHSNDFVPTTDAHIHDWNSFKIFSLSNPYSIFEPDIAPMKTLVNQDVFQSNLWEMTYRIGLFIPGLIVFLFSVLSLSVSSFSKHEKVIICSSIVSSLVMFCFSLNPDYRLSLVPLTYEIAPMFRVSVRSLLYLNISTIVILAILIVNVERAVYERYGKALLVKSMLSIVMIFLLICSYSDVSRVSVKGKMPVYPLPSLTLYEKLFPYPQGPLLELPFYSPASTYPEQNYQYLYNRSGHRKPLVNQVYTGMNNTKYLEALDIFSQKVNNPRDGYFDYLVSQGLMYIVVNGNLENITMELEKSKNVVLLTSSDDRMIYVAKDIDTLPTVDIGKFLDAVIINDQSIVYGD